ncbi:hypothetical protein TNCV_4096331 [Trichonephila clavipes]|nr:hypothetical protein TNCV_4096331 [Trichonephila clavipes]
MGTCPCFQKVVCVNFPTPHARSSSFLSPRKSPPHTELESDLCWSLLSNLFREVSLPLLYGDNSGHMAREASLHPISEKYMWNDCGLYPASM